MLYVCYVLIHFYHLLNLYPVSRRHRHMSGDPTDSDGDADDEDMMDENSAAMVLTALSVSPKSPTLPYYFTGKGETNLPINSELHKYLSVLSWLGISVLFGVINKYNFLIYSHQIPQSPI